MHLTEKPEGVWPSEHEKAIKRLVPQDDRKFGSRKGQTFQTLGATGDLFSH